MFKYKLRCVMSYPNAFGDRSKRYLIIQLAEPNNPKSDTYRLVVKNQTQLQVEEFYKSEYMELAKSLDAKIMNHLSDIGIFRTF